MSKAKKAASKMGVGFNELMLGITSKTLKWYFDKHGDKAEEVGVALPLSFNAVPKDRADYEYGNKFSSMCYYLKLESNLETACKEAKNRMDKIKKSWLPVGFYGLLWFYEAVCPTAFLNHIF